MPNFLQLQHVRSLSMLREVQINSKVHPVVCNGSIHPHFIRAEELQRVTKKKVQWHNSMGHYKMEHREWPHLDLKLQELHILHCLFKHSADIYLQHGTNIAVWVVRFLLKSIAITNDALFRILLWFHSVQGSAISLASHWSSLFFSNPVDSRISNWQFSVKNLSFLNSKLE